MMPLACPMTAPAKQRLSPGPGGESRLFVFHDFRPIDTRASRGAYGDAVSPCGEHRSALETGETPYFFGIGHFSQGLTDSNYTQRLCPRHGAHVNTYPNF